MGYICTCARAEVPPVSYIGNGRTDFAEIWCVVKDKLAKCFTEVMSGIHLHVARAYHSPYLGNGWTECAEIWCVAREPLAMRFTQTKGGVHLHVQMCKSLFRISETAGRIALKFGEWLLIN